jgi:hypothetical protein
VPPQVQAAAAAALAAAAAKAKLLADHEEREIQRLVVQAVDTQLRKVGRKGVGGGLGWEGAGWLCWSVLCTQRKGVGEGAAAAPQH